VVGGRAGGRTIAFGGVDEATRGRGRSAGRHVDRLVEGKRVRGRLSAGERTECLASTGTGRYAERILALPSRQSSGRRVWLLC
jgi:hypothetical protein